MNRQVHLSWDTFRILAVVSCAIALLMLTLAFGGCGATGDITKHVATAAKAVVKGAACTLKRTMTVCAPACRRCAASQAAQCILGVPAPAEKKPPTSQPAKP